MRTFNYFFLDVAVSVPLSFTFFEDTVASVLTETLSTVIFSDSVVSFNALETFVSLFSFFFKLSESIEASLFMLSEFESVLLSFGSPEMDSFSD